MRYRHDSCVPNSKRNLRHCGSNAQLQKHSGSVKYSISTNVVIDGGHMGNVMSSKLVDSEGLLVDTTTTDSHRLGEHF